MLVLTRGRHQNIVIGDNAEIRVRVLEVSGNQVKLGIEAPREIAVHREEIYERILRGEPRKICA